MQDYQLIIHGGAGTIRKVNLTLERETAIHKGLSDALQKGRQLLEKGSNALEAVVQAVTILEDNELFNAGKGSVYDAAGKHSLEASIMDGRNLNAGALAQLSTVKNPIQGAYAVLQKSDHVFLAGVEAQRFCRDCGLEMVDPTFFNTAWRYQSLLKAKAVQKPEELDESDRHGTVGAVAMDMNGNLAAATSTGGMTNKKFGRIGDTPVIGAATWAENSTCAVSTTGHGEYFIRLAIAKEVAACIEHAGMNLADASSYAIQKLADMGGSGGLIALDRKGNFALPFHAEGMYRGYLETGGVRTFIYD